MSTPIEGPSIPTLSPEQLGTESHMRSVIKGISWRALGTLDTMILSYLWTGSIKTATLIGSSEAMTKIFLFWAHERTWQKVRWGRITPSTSSP